MGFSYTGFGHWDRQFRPFCIEWNLLVVVEQKVHLATDVLYVIEDVLDKL
jgi:hypothetical protein